MRTTLLCLVLLISSTASATVLTSTRTTGAVAGTGGTTFTVGFPYLDQTHLVVTKTLVASPYTATVQTLGTHYTVSPTSLASSGTVIMLSAVSSAYTITVTRTVPVTQPTSYRTQGSYLPKTHEASFDRLTMIVQQLADGAITTSDYAAALAAHKAADDHTMYFKLAGRSGGQTAYGGTGIDDDLVLKANSDVSSTGVVTIEGLTLSPNGDAALGGSLDAAGSLTGNVGFMDTIYGHSGHTGILKLESDDQTAGATSKIYLGSHPVLVVNEYTNMVGIHTATPAEELDVVGDIGVTGTIYGTTGNGGDLLLGSTSTSGTANKGNIYFGVAKKTTYDEVNERLGIGVAAPTNALDVSGNALISGYYAGRRIALVSAITVTPTIPNSCGSTFIFTGDETLVTLPNIASNNAGCELTLINGNGTAADIAWDLYADDSIVGLCANTTATTLIAAVAGSYVVNLHAAANVGAAMTIVSDGVSVWWIKSCGGTWASSGGGYFVAP